MFQLSGFYCKGQPKWSFGPLWPLVSPSSTTIHPWPGAVPASGCVCMQACMYICVYAYMYLYIYIYIIHTYVYTHLYSDLYLYPYLYL